MMEGSFYDPELVAVVLFGFLFGSFLNVVIHRLPRGESIVFPGSHCPHCNGRLRWWHNLPVVSFVALRGRCATCRERIALRYPLVEVVAAAVVALVYLRFGPTLAFLLFAPFALALVALFVIDLEHQLLPDAITLPGTALGLVISPWNPETTVLEAVVGAALGYGSLRLLAATYQWLRGIPGLGGGDVKLAAMIGAFTGPKSLLAVMMLASLAGVFFGGALIVLRRADMQTALPFGCFLTPAALVVALVGGDVLWTGWQGFLVRYLY